MILAWWLFVLWDECWNQKTLFKFLNFHVLTIVYPFSRDYDKMSFFNLWYFHDTVHGFCTFLVVLMPRSCRWNLCTKAIDQNFGIELERFATFKQIWSDFCHLCAFSHIFVLVSDHIVVFSLHYFFGLVEKLVSKYPWHHL
jgi:hypothetical protein